MAERRLKKRKKKSGIRSFFSMFGALLLIAGVVISFIGAGIISSCLVEAFEFSPNDYQIARSSTLYYTTETGKSAVYEMVNSPSNLRWITSDKIPDNMKNAAVAIEDERFYSHHGVDIKRTLGAILGYVTGKDSYGGSTITQQVVKNITKDDERDATRKIREIFRALKFESEYSKDEILEFYLNIAYFGYGNGVQAASHAYFGKDVSDLNLAECASIVGITKYPSKYSPLLNPENNKERQEVVLGKMFELDMITKEEYDEAVAYQLKLNDGTYTEDEESKQSYFTELVIKEVIEDLVNEGKYSEAVAKSLVYNGGLSIYSTVDPEIQSIMENVLENKRNFTSDSTVQAAMVIIDPFTGQVKGLVGGAGEKTGDLVLNRAVDTFRQPGSTIKPLAVYGPAIEKGILFGPSSKLVDQPIDINGYKPHNWYTGYKGLVSLRDAIIWSMNTPSVQTVDQMGVNVSKSFLEDKYHISSITKTDGLAGVSLGGLSKGVNVLEWTAAYATFPNGGEWISPASYTKVLDHAGNVILEKKQQTENVFSEQTTYLMTDILQSTAHSSLIGGAIRGMSCAGKTGTTNNNVDKWYMGFTPYYVGGVWTGHDDSKPLSDGATPSAPQKIWKSVMSEVHKNLDDIGFDSAPKGVKKVALCASTGKLASSKCAVVYDIANTNTIKYCDGKHPSVYQPPSDHKNKKDEDEESESESDESQSSDENESSSSSASETTSQSSNESTVQPVAPSDSQQQ